MPNTKVIAAFYLAAGIIMYCAYATLLPSPDLPNPMQHAKRATR